MKNRSSRSSKRRPDRGRTLDAGLALEPDEHHEFFSEGESGNYSGWPGQDGIALEEALPELAGPRVVRTPEMDARREKFKRWVLVLVLLLLIPIGAGALWQQARSSKEALVGSNGVKPAPQRTVAVSGVKPETTQRGASQSPTAPPVQTPNSEATLTQEAPSSETLVLKESKSVAPGPTTSNASPVPTASTPHKPQRFRLPPMMRPALPGTPPTVAYPVN